MRARPNYTRRVVAGGTLSPSWDPATGAFGLGVGVDTMLVATDAGRLQPLTDLIDDKDLFSVPAHLEVASYTIDSAAEVRSMATATASAVESTEARAECLRIADACRQYLRDVKAITNPVVLEAALDALRADTLPSVWVLVSLFDLHAPRRIAATSRDRFRGIALLEAMLE